MLTFYRKYWRTAFDLLLIALTVYLIMLVFSYIYKIATPVFMAFVIYLIIEPFARWLQRRNIRKSIATAIAMLVFILVFLSVVLAASAIFVIQVSNLVGRLQEYTGMLQHALISQTDNIRRLSPYLPADWMAKLQQYTPTILSKGSHLLQVFFMTLIGMAGSLSTFFMNFAIGVVLAYFLSVEIDMWRKVAREKTPRTFKTAFSFLRQHVLIGIGGYVKAQLKLIAITFGIIFIGLLILGVGNSFSIALLCAFFDLLPLLGVATVFVPWIIYLLIVGQTHLAIGIGVLFLVVIVTRQILEPKITGDSLGVSAFTMLSFMIVSLSLFGVAGLILSPVLIILIKELYAQGYLQKWIRLPADEFGE